MENYSPRAPSDSSKNQNPPSKKLNLTAFQKSKPLPPKPSSINSGKQKIKYLLAKIKEIHQDNNDKILQKLYDENSKANSKVSKKKALKAENSNKSIESTDSPSIKETEEEERYGYQQAELHYDDVISHLYFNNSKQNIAQTHEDSNAFPKFNENSSNFNNPTPISNNFREFKPDLDPKSAKLTPFGYKDPIKHALSDSSLKFRVKPQNSEPSLSKEISSKNSSAFNLKKIGSHFKFSATQYDPTLMPNLNFNSGRFVPVLKTKEVETMQGLSHLEIVEKSIGNAFPVASGMLAHKRAENNKLLRKNWNNENKIQTQKTSRKDTFISLSKLEVFDATPVGIDSFQNDIEHISSEPLDQKEIERQQEKSNFDSFDDAGFLYNNQNTPTCTISPKLPAYKIKNKLSLKIPTSSAIDSSDSKAIVKDQLENKLSGLYIDQPDSGMPSDISSKSLKQESNDKKVRKHPDSINSYSDKPVISTDFSKLTRSKARHFYTPSPKNELFRNDKKFNFPKSSNKIVEQVIYNKVQSSSEGKININNPSVENIKKLTISSDIPLFKPQAHSATIFNQSVNIVDPQSAPIDADPHFNSFSNSVIDKNPYVEIKNQEYSNVNPESFPINQVPLNMPRYEAQKSSPHPYFVTEKEILVKIWPSYTNFTKINVSGLSTGEEILKKSICTIFGGNLPPVYNIKCFLVNENNTLSAPLSSDEILNYSNFPQSGFPVRFLLEICGPNYPDSTALNNTSSKTKYSASHQYSNTNSPYMYSNSQSSSPKINPPLTNVFANNSKSSNQYITSTKTNISTEGDRKPFLEQGGELESYPRNILNSETTLRSSNRIKETSSSFLINTQSPSMVHSASGSLSTVKNHEQKLSETQDDSNFNLFNNVSRVSMNFINNSDSSDSSMKLGYISDSLLSDYLESKLTKDDENYMSDHNSNSSVIYHSKTALLNRRKALDVIENPSGHPYFLNRLKAKSGSKKSFRQSRMDLANSSNKAPLKNINDRPNADLITAELDLFFPGHDFDQPVLEAIRVPIEISSSSSLDELVKNDLSNIEIITTDFRNDHVGLPANEFIKTAFRQSISFALQRYDLHKDSSPPDNNQHGFYNAHDQNEKVTRENYKNNNFMLQGPDIEDTMSSENSISQGDFSLSTKPDTEYIDTDEPQLENYFQSKNLFVAASEAIHESNQSDLASSRAAARTRGSRLSQVGMSIFRSRSLREVIRETRLRRQLSDSSSKGPVQGAEQEYKEIQNESTSSYYSSYGMAQGNASTTRFSFEPGDSYPIKSSLSNTKTEDSNNYVNKNVEVNKDKASEYLVGKLEPDYNKLLSQRKRNSTKLWGLVSQELLPTKKLGFNLNTSDAKSNPTPDYRTLIQDISLFDNDKKNFNGKGFHPQEFDHDLNYQNEKFHVNLGTMDNNQKPSAQYGDMQMPLITHEYIFKRAISLMRKPVKQKKDEMDLVDKAFIVNKTSKIKTLSSPQKHGFGGHSKDYSWWFKNDESLVIEGAESKEAVDLFENLGLPETPAQIQWIKGRLIGKGSFGHVFLALNVSTGEVMAVKQIKIPINRQSDINTHGKRKKFIKQLHSEISMLKDLDHINIVQYLGFEIRDRLINIFLEYVSGGTISSLISQHGPLAEPVICSFLNQILQCLDYLHKNNIIHRDIKSANILVEENGVCKLSDFGISIKENYDQKHESRSKISVQGSIFWMAPEIFKKSEYTPKVDIWSLGCVFIETWTGRRPWYGYDPVQVMFKLGKESIPPLSDDLPPDGLEFAKKCLVVDPEGRSTANELLKLKFVQPSPTYSYSDYYEPTFRAMAG
ncbi:hypothetical protein BB560_005443 [Smittium megazygosporum]|uniref:Protein kinase domain-containing protein n=1 Tax=Smittium megazygosporum TaxID=133381 RepID=A0A2T9Z5A0_9FUNG|nr:hypothetical protein BB560_005443 [Smittium megazygosporum]